MDNLGSSNPQRDNHDVPIPLDDPAEKPVRPEGSPASGPPGVSRAPLNLGGGTGAPAAAPVQAPKPPAPAPAQTPRPAPAATSAPAQAPRPAAPAATAPAARPAAPRPIPSRPAAAVGAGNRITGCKTFFTKLHPGAIKFLEEQITTWLKDNPTIIIKSTNVIMGEVQEKKTEPNIVIVVWY
jgi:hypothetical protein